MKSETKLNFDSWYQQLQSLAAEHGENVSDVDAWLSEFEDDRTPEEAFFSEYPEHTPVNSKTRAQHKKPCKECPWRRKSLPGWLGASEPGEFLAQSDSQIRMPCHMAGIDYDAPDWKEQASKAPQCAGRAIFQENRCQLPAQGLLRLPADPTQVFSRPHEFVAHHAQVDPKTLETVMVYDLYDVTKP